MEIAIQIRNVSFATESRPVFRDLNLKVLRGEALLILGSSGSGKSLLLKLCAGLTPLDEGEVRMGDVDLASASKETLQELRAKMGFVFQNSALISNMVLYDNIALPLRYHRHWSEAEVRARVDEVMELFGVEREYERSIPARLSWEMHKRAALARAFVLHPEILLLDQPTSGLESDTAEDLARLIREYQQKSGASILEVSGEWPAFGAAVDRVGLLEGGRIQSEGTVEEMERVLKNVKPEPKGNALSMDKGPSA